MNLSWTALILHILVLGSATYITIWVVAGSAMPLWLRIFTTSVIGVGLILMIVLNLLPERRFKDGS